MCPVTIEEELWQVLIPIHLFPRGYFFPRYQGRSIFDIFYNLLLDLSNSHSSPHFSFRTLQVKPSKSFKLILGLHKQLSTNHHFLIYTILLTSSPLPSSPVSLSTFQSHQPKQASAPFFNLVPWTDSYVYDRTFPADRGMSLGYKLNAYLYPLCDTILPKR